MAAGNVRDIIRAPGKIILNQTQNFDGNTAPYGGTEIGKTRLGFTRSFGVPFEVTSEGLGEVQAVLEPDNNWSYTFFARGWDDDAIRLLMAQNYAAGAVTQHSMFQVPGNTPGSSTDGRTITLAFVPDDPIHVPGVLVYQGVANWDEGMQLAFQRQEELGLPITVKCLCDANGNTIKVARLNDITLT